MLSADCKEDLPLIKSSEQSNLHNPGDLCSFDLVCYGLGNFTTSIEAREQLLCLLELKELQVSYNPGF